MSFTQKTIVLAGASAGIGKSLALILAYQGANLVLAARHQTALAEVVGACIEVGGKAIAVPTDVTQPEDCRKLVEAAIAAFGQIDILVNNAGISMLTAFDQVTDLSIFEQVMQVNYLGAVYCTHFALALRRHLKADLACDQNDHALFP